jgi:putative ABC transport system permease protein
VTLISMMSVGAASISATESSALDRVAPVDLTVTGGTVSPRLVDVVRDVEGVRYAVAAQGITVGTKDGKVVVGALPPDALPRVVRDGALVAQLARAAVVTVPMGAQSEVPGNGLRPFLLRAGDVEVRVSPVLSSLTAGPMLIAPSVLQRLGGHPEPVALYAELADDADAQGVIAGVHDAIASAQPDSALAVTAGFATRSTYDRTISVLLLVATALLGVAVLIALVGVGNTLSLSVLERTRENGLLRALGLTTRQLRLLLANEALLIAGSAAVLGTALGIAYGWAGTLTLLHGTTTHSPTLAIPVARLALIIVVAVVAGLLASVLPARRAVRLSPTEALVAD